jgi:hypothetical protein
LRTAVAVLWEEAEVAVIGGGFTEGLETVAEVAESARMCGVRLGGGDVGGVLVPRADEHVRSTLGRLGVEDPD